MHPFTRILLLFAALSLSLFGEPSGAANLPASLQGITATQITTGNYKSFLFVQTCGYATCGDGGGGVNYSNAATTSCTANGGSIIKDAASNCWYSVGFPSNAKQWGILADSPNSNMFGDADGTAVIKNTATTPSTYFSTGSKISGTNIPAGATVLSTTSSTITISALTTGSTTKIGLNGTDNATQIAAMNTACIAAALASGTAKQACTITWPASPANLSYATSGLIDFRDHSGVFYQGAGLGITMLKYIGTNAATQGFITFGCNVGVCSNSTPVKSGGVSGMYINANGLAAGAVNISGLSDGGLFMNNTMGGGTVYQLNLESPYGTTSFTATQNTLIDGVNIDASQQNNWFGAKPNMAAVGIDLSDNTSPGCINSDTCQFLYGPTGVGTGTITTPGTTYTNGFYSAKVMTQVGGSGLCTAAIADITVAGNAVTIVNWSSLNDVRGTGCQVGDVLTATIAGDTVFRYTISTVVRVGQQTTTTHNKFTNCTISADRIAVGLMIGSSQGNSFAYCQTKQTNFAKRNASNITDNFGGAGTTLCIPNTAVTSTSIVNNLGQTTGSYLQNALVTDANGNVPANTYVTTIVGNGSGSPCATTTLQVTISNALTASVSGEQVNFDAGFPTIMPTLKAGNGTWANGVAQKMSDWIVLPAGQTISTLRPGDTVTDLTTAANIPTVTIPGGNAVSNFVVMCADSSSLPVSCGVATRVKLAVPVLVGSAPGTTLATDVVQFSTEHQGISLNDTPLGVSTGNGAGQYEYFYNTQTGGSQARVWNRYRPPVSFDFPSAGYQDNNFIQNSSLQGGAKTLLGDPGSVTVSEASVGQSTGVTHVAEDFMAGVNNNDASTFGSVQNIQQQFNNGNNSAAVTTAGFKDDTLGNIEHRDYSLTYSTCEQVDSGTGGSIKVTTGCNLTEGKALKLLSIAKCAPSTTPQFGKCQSENGREMLEVSGGLLAQDAISRLNDITITNAGGVVYHDTNYNCYGNLTDRVLVADQTHLLMVNTWTQGGCAGGVMQACGTLGGVPGNTAPGSGCDALLWDGNMSVQQISARGNNGGNQTYTVGDATPFDTTANNLSEFCVVNNGTARLNGQITVTGKSWAAGILTLTLSYNPGLAVGQYFALSGLTYTGTNPNGSWAATSGTTGTTLKLAVPDPGTLGGSGLVDPNQLMILGIAAGVITTNATYDASDNATVIACLPVKQPTHVLNSGGVGAQQFGQWLPVSGVQMQTDGGSPAHVQLKFTSGTIAKLKTGQFVCVTGAASGAAFVQGCHPITVISATLATMNDVPFLTGASYSGTVTATWLDPAVTITCSGQTTRPNPTVLNGLTTGQIYLDGNNSCLPTIKTYDGSTANTYVLGQGASITGTPTTGHAASWASASSIQDAGVALPASGTIAFVPPSCQSGAQITGAADTNENTLAVCTIPAGTLGANGCMIINVTFGMTPTSATAVTGKAYLSTSVGVVGTAYAGAGQAYVTGSSSSSGTRQFNIPNVTVCNRNSASSQVGGATNGANGATNNSVTTSAINTANVFYVNFTGQKTTAGDVVTVEQFTVQLRPAA